MSSPENVLDSVLITWRDALDHDLAAIRELEKETRQMARDGHSLDPEGAGACADLLDNIASSITRVRMDIHTLAAEAGEADPKEVN